MERDTHGVRRGDNQPIALQRARFGWANVLEGLVARSGRTQGCSFRFADE
jgi:hypothetical protein